MPVKLQKRKVDIFISVDIREADHDISEIKQYYFILARSMQLCENFSRLAMTLYTTQNLIGITSNIFLSYTLDKNQVWKCKNNKGRLIRMLVSWSYVSSTLHSASSPTTYIPSLKPISYILCEKIDRRRKV